METLHGGPDGILPIEKSLQSKTLSEIGIQQLNYIIYFDWRQFYQRNYNTRKQYQKFYFNEVSTFGYRGWIFPGQGIKYVTCGTHHFKGCANTRAHPESKLYVKRVKDNCHRAECPECSPSWMVKTTEKAQERIKQGKPNRNGTPIHVTLSPPKSEYFKYKTDQGAKKQRRKANRIAKNVGMTGAMVTFHPYRESCSKCGGEKGYKNMKICKKCGNDTFLWYWSPHYHLIGYGWITGVANNYVKTGWIVKNHRIRKDVGATIYYQLSHCGIKKGFHSISWIGCLSWRNLKIRKKLSEILQCPYCGNVLRNVSYYGGTAPKMKEGLGKLVNPHKWRYAKNG
jgi:hypothetical protein